MYLYKPYNSSFTVDDTLDKDVEEDRYEAAFWKLCDGFMYNPIILSGITTIPEDVVDI